MRRPGKRKPLTTNGVAAPLLDGTCGALSPTCDGAYANKLQISHPEEHVFARKKAQLTLNAAPRISRTPGYTPFCTVL